MTGLASIKKGDEVVLLGFTGIRLKTFTVKSATKTEITIATAEKGDLTFDRKTGKQTNAANPKYANKLVHPDDAPAQKKPATKKKKVAEAPKEKKGKTVKTIEPPEEDDEEDEEVPAPKKTSKKPAPKKKPAKVVEEDDDEDNDNDDDEEYEEV